MKTAVSNVAPGQVVKFHGEPCIVLEHRTAGTLLVTADQIKSSFGSTNNFAASSFREHLNGAFADALTEGHADELITREVDLTALNGSKEYGSCECKVAPLTFDEIRRFHGLLPKPESWEWSATPWSTPCVDEDDTWVMGLNTSGGVGNYYCTNTCGSRPAFLIPSQYYDNTSLKAKHERKRSLEELTKENKELKTRLQATEEDLTNTQVALTEVYEMLAGGGENG